MSHYDIIGIDPGLHGGMAWIEHDNTSIHVTPMILAGKEIDGQRTKQWLMDHTHYPTKVFIEAVHSMPGQGVASMFHFGMVYGLIQGIVLTLGLPMFLITPQRWKKFVLSGLPYKEDPKQTAIDFVVRAFPQISILATERSRTPHSGMADAICLAYYGYFNSQD